MKRSTLAGLGTVAGLVIALEVLTTRGLVSPWIVPPPSEIGRAAVPLWREEGLAHACLVTLAETLAAIGVAAALGLVLGYLLYAHRALGEAYESWLGALFASPTVLLYPLFLVVLGRSVATIVAMAVIAGTIPVAIKMREALLSVPGVLVAVGRGFELTPRQVFWKVMLPAAAPTIFTGVRLGLVYALVSVVGIEFLIELGGLGRLASEMYFRYQVAAMYAVIVVIVGVSLLFFWGLQGLETRLRSR